VKALHIYESLAANRHRGAELMTPDRLVHRRALTDGHSVLAGASCVAVLLVG
jgi:hypothetical protein